MFGILSDVLKATVVQPAVDTLDVLEGLSEGELRERAIVRLGADVVAGMAVSEILDALSE